MRTFFTCIAVLLTLAAGFVLGQVSPPAKELLARARALVQPEPRAAAAVADDIADLIAKCDERIRALQTARDHAAAERRLLQVEGRILRRWGEPEHSTQLVRVAEADAALDQRDTTLAQQLAELHTLADKLRGLPESARRSDALARPAWVDEARVRLRVAELGASAR